MGTGQHTVWEETVEFIAGCCQDVANVPEAVSVKNARGTQPYPEVSDLRAEEALLTTPTPPTI